MAVGGVRDARNPTGHSWRWIRAWSEPTTARGGAGGDARRGAACKPFCGSGACAKRVWGLHKTRERLCRGRVVQRGAVGHLPWRGRGVRGGENAGVRCPGT